MKEWTGVVSTTESKEWRPGVFLHTFQLEGEDLWFRTGTKKVVEVGETVHFKERNSQVDVASLSTSTGQAGSTNPFSIITDSSTSPSGDAVSTRIQYQAARRDATSLIVAALNAEGHVEGGVLPWPKNLAKSKRLDVLRGYIGELTQQFLEEEHNEL